MVKVRVIGAVALEATASTEGPAGLFEVSVDDQGNLTHVEVGASRRAFRRLTDRLRGEGERARTADLHVARLLRDSAADRLTRISAGPGGVPAAGCKGPRQHKRPASSRRRA